MCREIGTGKNNRSNPFKFFKRIIMVTFTSSKYKRPNAPRCFSNFAREKRQHSKAECSAGILWYQTTRKGMNKTCWEFFIRVVCTLKLKNWILLFRCIVFQVSVRWKREIRPQFERFQFSSIKIIKKIRDNGRVYSCCDGGNMRDLRTNCTQSVKCLKLLAMDHPCLF